MKTDPSYIVLGSQTEGQLATEVSLYLDRGYLLAGGVTVGKDGRFHQAVVKRNIAPVGEIHLREPKRK